MGTRNFEHIHCTQSIRRGLLRDFGVTMFEISVAATFGKRDDQSPVIVDLGESNFDCIL